MVVRIREVKLIESLVPITLKIFWNIKLILKHRVES